MKRVKSTMTFWLCLLALSVFAKENSPFTMNGWQFHEYDIPKLAEAINKAPEYGVNFFIFSHELFRSVEAFNVSGPDFDPVKTLQLPQLARLRRGPGQAHAGWQKDIAYLGSLAQKNKIPFYLWIHELDELPPEFVKEGRANLDDPKIIPFLEKRYEKLLLACPTTAGFVLTFHESQYKIFRNKEVQSSWTVPERIYRLTKLIYDVAKKHNKQLILRNFFYEPLEMDYFKQALDRLPDDLIVMSKDTFHEFDPFYPPDSMHGQVGKKRQIIEIDLGVEKAWSRNGAYAQLNHIQFYARRAREKGLAGMVGRNRMHWDKPFEDSHEINLYAFSRFMENPDLTTDQVVLDWAKRRYPESAAPYIASAMKRSEFIQHHGRWHLEFWLTKSIGAEWDDYNYYFGHIHLRSRYKWSQNPADKELEQKLYFPDMATYNKLVAEKDEVLRQVQAGIDDLEMASMYLTPAQMAPLEEDFRFLSDAARLQKEWIRAFYAQRLYMQKPADEYKMMAEDALRKLEEMDRLPGVTYGLNRETGHRYNIEKFVLEMRWRMTNRNRALAEDKRIFEEMDQVMDVKDN